MIHNLRHCLNKGMLSIFLACAFSFVWLCSYLSNRDLLSPIKLYLLTLFICFFDIFLSPYRLDICCIYLGLLFVALTLTIYESQAGSQLPSSIGYHKHAPLRTRSSGRTVAVIWGFTILPVVSMGYLITLFGGVTNYLGKLGTRALAFQGLNTFSELAINLISLLTVLYFGIGMIERRSPGWWTCYSLHFAIALTILSISGSRRYFIMPFIMMLALSHYFRSNISAKRAGAFLCFLLIITSAIGVLRMGQRGSDFLARDLSEYERESVTAHFKYGLVPLEVVLGADVLTLHYGSTFISALTNVIPRPLWPEKPDSAGLVITKDYLGDRWLGASNLNAGLPAESVMNFGLTVGMVFTFVSLSAAMAFLVNRYRRVLVILRREGRSVRAVFYLVRYLHIAIAITSLITWETSIVSLPLILNLSAMSVMQLLIRMREAAISRKCG
jgi:hypothetical protein